MKPAMSLTLSALVAVLGVATGTAVAHHSVSAQFDYDKPFDLTGKLERVEWVNPHSYLYFKVTESGKTTDWSIESFGVAGLRTKGLNKDVLKVGNTYRIRGFKARNGKPNGFLQEIEFSDGKMYRIWSGDPNGK